MGVANIYWVLKFSTSIWLNKCWKPLSFIKIIEVEKTTWPLRRELDEWFKENPHEPMVYGLCENQHGTSPLGYTLLGKRPSPVFMGLVILNSALLHHTAAPEQPCIPEIQMVYPPLWMWHSMELWWMGHGCIVIAHRPTIHNTIHHFFVHLLTSLSSPSPMGPFITGKRSRFAFMYTIYSDNGLS